MNYLYEKDKQILRTYYADYELYGVKFDGSRAYLKVQYTRRVTPEFTPVVVGREDSKSHCYLHPKKVRGCEIK